VTNDEQVQWEARLGRPAAVAAWIAGVLLLAGTITLLSIPKDRPHVRSRPDFLLSVHDEPGKLIAATVLQGLAAVFLVFVFLYLFRAIAHRSERLPRWFVYIVIAGPLMYAAAQVIGALIQVDVADKFAAGGKILGKAGEDRATDLISDNVSPPAVALGLAGSVAVGFLFVMLPLRARQVGLLSPFMSVLGIICGVLFVLPILPGGVPVIVQAFWLGALGALFLNRWPRGRGPAWESGEAVPWPTPPGRERRSLLGGPGGQPEPEPPPEPEPVPERPSSRKRRRRKKR
jgi:hypothetical protein